MKNCVDFLKDINSLNEITHNHSIIAIRDDFNEYSNRFLVYDDPDWECKLFLNYHNNEINNEEYIKDHISRDFKINKDDISVYYKDSKVSQKISGRDKKKKTYSHKLFLVKIKNFPDYMKNDEFEDDTSRHFYWKSIAELESDKDAMEKNNDIITFVKQSI